ncbi:hypothetical protein QJQ45_022183 [Haematococcus lacustris]|nr:hypothetical protein QJQ45_022183 [Haematococcus lacustris]
MYRGGFKAKRRKSTSAADRAAALERARLVGIGRGMAAAFGQDVKPSGSSSVSMALAAASQASGVAELVAAQQAAARQRAAATAERAAAAAQAAAAAAEEEENGVEGEEDEEEMDHANVYTQYRPSKLTEGRDHPDPIVESQSLSGTSPPDPDYAHHLGREVAEGRISNAQLETVVYACMRFKRFLPSGERCGFFLGDGAGVGKGRQIAALVKDFWAGGGRRALWVSTSRDLSFDAQRDLDDMDARHIQVFPKAGGAGRGQAAGQLTAHKEGGRSEHRGKKNALPKGSLARHFPEGVLFVTYSMLSMKGKGGASKDEDEDMDMDDELPSSSKKPGPGRGAGARAGAFSFTDKEAVVKAREKKRSAQRDKKNAGLQDPGSRLSQLVQWLGGEDGSGEHCLVVLDECHRAKNLVDTAGGSTMTGLAVEALQVRLPKARVLYSSATGASEPQNMLYMRRVGCFGFPDMASMIKMLKKSGLGAVEMFSMGLKATGAYLSRTLSYKDAEFRLDQIDLHPAFRVLYDRAAQFWTLLLKITEQVRCSQAKPPLVQGGWHRARLGSGCRLQDTWTTREASCPLAQLPSQPAFSSSSRASLLHPACCPSVLQLPKATGRRDLRKSLMWASHQRFFKGLLIASKVRRCSELALQALADGMCVVIGMQSTGEANMTQARELEGNEMNDLVSAPKMVLQQYVSKHMFNKLPPMPGYDMNKLLAQVAQVVREWERLPSCQEAAVQELKEDARRQARLQTLRDKAAAAKEQDEARQAAGAGAPGRAQPAGVAGAVRAGGANAGPAGGGGESDDEVQVTKEAGLDEALETRRKAALLSGNFIDLTDPKMDAAKVAKAVAELDAEEKEAEREAEARKYAAKEAALLEALVSGGCRAGGGCREGAGQLQGRAAGQVVSAGQPESGREGPAAETQSQVRSATWARSGAGVGPGWMAAASLCHQAAAEARLTSLSLDTVAGGVEGVEGQAALEDPLGPDAAGGAGQQAAPQSAGRRRRAVVDDDEAEVVVGGDKAGALTSAACANGHGSAAGTKRGRGRTLVVVDTDSEGAGAGQQGSDAEQPARKRPTRGRQASRSSAVSKSKKKAHDSDEEGSEEASEDEDEEDESEGSLAEDDEEFVVEDEVPAQQRSRSTRAQSVISATPEASDSDVTLGSEGSGGVGSDGEARVQRPRSVRLASVGKRQASPDVRVKEAGSAPLAPQPLVRSEVRAARLAVDQARAALTRAREQRAKQLAIAADADKTSAALTTLAGPGPGSSKHGSSAGNGSLGQAGPPQLPQYRMAVKNKPLAKARGGKKARGHDSDESLSAEDGIDPESDGPEQASEEMMMGGEEDDELELQALPLPMRRIRKLLLRLVDSMELPPNPLDQLTELLGGEGKVAEMTGRKGMLVRGQDGRVSYKQRREEEAQKMVNLKEKDDFMEGKKVRPGLGSSQLEGVSRQLEGASRVKALIRPGLVAIISEAASTGISLQADRRVANQRRRFHITLELPWSADRAIQQFGRSHRSNQSSAPIYCLLVTKCGGEYRFAGAVAKRLASLGALLQGDQRALGAAANLKAYDIDNAIAHKALSRVYDDLENGSEPMPGVRIPLLPDDAYDPVAMVEAGGLPEELPAAVRRHAYHQAMKAALVDVGLARNVSRFWAPDGIEVPPAQKQDVPRFLNRLLGLPIGSQGQLFEYFADTLTAQLKVAKSEGRFQEGMTVLRDCKVSVEEDREIHRDATTDAVTRHLCLKVDDGLAWPEALAQRDERRAELRAAGLPEARIAHTGYYVSRVEHKGYRRPHVLLAVEIQKRSADERITRFRIQRPYQHQGGIWPLDQLQDKYRLAKTDAEAKAVWQAWYDALETGCMHGPNCASRKAGYQCDMGCRTYRKHIICGAILPILHTLFSVVETSRFGRDSKGSKPPPRALRCTITLDEPGAAGPAPSSAAQQAAVPPQSAAQPPSTASPALQQALARRRGPGAPSAAGTSSNSTPKPAAATPARRGRPAASGAAASSVIDLCSSSDEEPLKQRLASQPPVGAAQVAVAPVPPAGQQPGAAPTSPAGAPAQPTTKLLVGYNLLAPDVEMLLQALALD